MKNGLNKKMKLEYYKLIKEIEDTLMKYEKDRYKGMYLIQHNSMPNDEELRFFVTLPAHRIIKLLEKEYKIEVYDGDEE